MAGVSNAMLAFWRTIVPMLWGGVVGALLSKGIITPEVAETMNGWAPAIVTGLAVVSASGVYALMNWLMDQRWFPTWLATIFTGSSKKPDYSGVNPAPLSTRLEQRNT